MRAPRRRCVVVAIALLAGCSVARESYYNAWEKVGYAKRERLVDDVRGARDSQGKAKKEFVSALEEFKSVTHFSGGDLEAAYDKLNARYTACNDRAAEVKAKIETVKHVADALFSEWKGEIGEIQDDDSLRRQSQALLDKSKENYAVLAKKMDRAAAAMDPVLKKFHNRVLFLKANLNAQAIGSLEGTTAEMSKDIDALVREMERSIAEADTFIAGMNTK